MRGPDINIQTDFSAARDGIADNTKASYLQLHNISIGGSASTDQKTAVLLNGCEYAQLTDCTIANTTGSGLSLAKCTDTSLVGCTFRNCGEYGIFDARSKGTVVVSSTFEDNGSGDSNLPAGTVIP